VLGAAINKEPILQSYKKFCFELALQFNWRKQNDNGRPKSPFEDDSDEDEGEDYEKLLTCSASSEVQKEEWLESLLLATQNHMRAETPKEIVLEAELDENQYQSQSRIMLNERSKSDAKIPTNRTKTEESHVKTYYIFHY
jgi:hypothetical protein